MQKLASGAESRWFGGWNSNIQSDVNNYVTDAYNHGANPVLVAYNIPQRDCGGYSAGGAGSPDAYRSWITAFANGIGSRTAAVVLEPDALPGMDCLSSADQQTRLSLMNYAVDTFKSKGGIKVYIDAGGPNWQSPATMATRLTQAGIAKADGFSSDVSGFDALNLVTQYGTSLSQLLGGKHFVIDTSRDGNGSNGQWCNPSGRALGMKPTTSTGNPIIDAYLWIKVPGESDGSCNGGPSAGTFWDAYALDLAKNTTLY